MIDKIKRYLLDNNYNGHGLKEHIENTSNDRRYKVHWLAATYGGLNQTRSGIIKYQGIKYYFSCIAPWVICPAGSITVEIVRGY